MNKVMINIGTAERPCLVPEDALFTPNSPKGNSWWEKVATGSVVISDKELERALKISKRTGGLISDQKS